MIEVVAIDGGITKYDGEGTEYRLVDGGHLSITEEYGDRGFTHSIAVHAAGTWAIVRKATA